jgi:hypothetical protein
MQQLKIRPFVCLAVLIFATMVACSASTPVETQQPAGQKPAEFEVGPITFEPPVVMVGDTVTVTATVSNIGGTAGTYIAALSVDGQEVDAKVISVDPGSSQNVSFQFSRTTAGSYQLMIDNSSAVLTVNNWSPYTIQYDESDGVAEGIYVSGDNGHIVRFSPPAQAFKIQKIRIFGFVKPRDTDEFDKNHVTVRIWDKDGNNQLWNQDFPWRLFIEGSWQDIQVPDIRVNDDFEVEVVTHSDPAGGDPIDFLSIGSIPPEKISYIGGVYVFQAGEKLPSVVCIGFDYPESYISSPSNRPETRSGYSYMGKLIDPGQKRLEGINWLIRVEGEGTTGN